MLKIEDLKVGDELVCIDCDGFLSTSGSSRHSANIKEISKSKIIISHVYKDFVELKNTSLFLNDFDLKYFKKKEQSQQHTFDDLIDVAVQAFKDGKLFSVGITVCGVSARLPDKQSEILFINTEVKRGMEYIQSLYKETFVIECEDDLNKIKREVGSIVLSNGEDIIDDVKFSENKPYFTNDGVSWVRVPFSVLKGATVEQERGRDD